MAVLVLLLCNLHKTASRLERGIWGPKSVFLGHGPSSVTWINYLLFPFNWELCFLCWQSTVIYPSHANGDSYCHRQFFSIYTTEEEWPSSAYSPANREQDLCWRIGWLNTGQVMHRHLQLPEIHESSVLSAFISY